MLKGRALLRLRLRLQALDVVGDRLQKGGQTYHLLGDLPTSPMGVIMLYNERFFRNTVEAICVGAVSEIDTLGDEMVGWLDGLESNPGLSQTDKCYQVGGCVDVLQYVSDLFIDVTDNLPSDVAELSVLAVPPYDVKLMTGRSRYLGRGRRAANVAGALQRVAEAVEDWLDGAGDPSGDVRPWLDKVRELVDELSAIDFPSMF
jgi:hypothetical protein